METLAHGLTNNSLNSLGKSYPKGHKKPYGAGRRRDVNWIFTDDRPIYLQLVEQINLGILSNEFPPGSQVPSVRDLAMDAEVNPNTMQKALVKLEESGLIHSERTSGRFVTEDKVMIDKLRNDLAKEHTRQFLDNIKKLGLTKIEIIAMIENTFKEEK